MKKFKLLIPVIILLVSQGCKKELPGPVPSRPVVNTPPQVISGPHFSVFLPVNTAFVNGSATDAENNLDSCWWRQLSGPNQANIQTPYSITSNISNLIKGQYSFELTVIDKLGLSGKDTTNINVMDTSGTNFTILEALDVTCWGPECTVLVDTSNTHLYLNVPFKVFLKSINASVWEEIPQQNYFFSSNDKYFWIIWYNLNETIKWEVMIVY